MHHIHWEIIISKGASNSLEAMKGSRNTFTWELGNIKGPDVSLESILNLLISHSHALDDVSKGSDGTTAMFRNTVEIQFDFSMKYLFHQ